MGDCCYMSVTCRREDEDKFEGLEFASEFEISPGCLVVELVDAEANYAHHDEMPANIPYIATYSAGSNYGAGSIACDGKTYVEIARTGDGFVVDWDYRKMKPTAQCLTKIRKFIQVEKRVKRMLNRLRQQEPHQHRFSPVTNRCHHCGIPEPVATTKLNHSGRS